MIVATITQAAGGARIRVSPAQLIIDAKTAIGMGATNNTAYGPQMNDRLRAFATTRSVPDSDLPPVSTAPQWRNAPALSGNLVRLLVWAAYAHGMPLAAVSIESSSNAPRWGMAATGVRAPAQREPLTRADAPVPSPTGGPPPAGPPPAPSPASPTGGPPPAEPSPAAEAPSPSSTADAPAVTGACTVAMPSAWHLRDTETAASEGRSYPAGERIEILRVVPGVSRGASERFFRVRVLSDRREGFAFIPSASVPSCAPLTVGDAVGGGIGVGMQATLKLVGKVVVGVVGTGLVLATVAAVMRRRQRARAVLRLNAPAAPPPTPQTKASRST